MIRSEFLKTVSQARGVHFCLDYSSKKHLKSRKVEPIKIPCLYPDLYARDDRVHSSVSPR